MKKMLMLSLIFTSLPLWAAPTKYVFTVNNTGATECAQQILEIHAGRLLNVNRSNTLGVLQLNQALNGAELAEISELACLRHFEEAIQVQEAP